MRAPCQTSFENSTMVDIWSFGAGRDWIICQPSSPYSARTAVASGAPTRHASTMPVTVGVLVDGTVPP